MNTSLTASTQYYFIVAAINSEGTGAYTASVSVLTDSETRTMTRTIIGSTETDYFVNDVNPRANIGEVKINLTQLVLGGLVAISCRANHTLGAAVANININLFPNYLAASGSTQHYCVLSGGTAVTTPAADLSNVFYAQPPADTAQRIVRIEKDADTYVEILTGVVPTGDTSTLISGSLADSISAQIDHGAQWGRGRLGTNGFQRPRIWGTVVALAGTLIATDSVTITRIFRTTTA